MMIIAQSPASRAMLSLLRRYACYDVPLLIEGETGTGKELAAREIHYAGPRTEKPFVPVNCGALPDSLIESELFGHLRGAFTDAKCEQPGLIDHARGGTLFLDEVDSLSPKAQVTLLRFLQDRQYRPVGGGATRTADVRVIAATNAPLMHLVEEGAFRRDLYYRLNVLHLRIAPLRERPADILALAAHFLQASVQQLDVPEKRWSEAAQTALLGHAWPGNVRELENIVLRACVCAEGAEIGVAELAVADPAFREMAVPQPSGTRDDTGFTACKSRAIASFERGYLTELLRGVRGNVTAAARLGGIERRQLGRLLKKHGIERRSYR